MYEWFCNVCCKITKFKFIRDDGKDEVYRCEGCNCLHRVAVR